MSIADAIPAVTAARSARQAARVAERAARDAFIQAQFPLMAARFEALLDEALGHHAGITVSVTPVVETVTARTFATMNERVVAVRSTIGAPPQTVTFTPALAFREADQFGAINCALDFPYTPLRSRRDLVASALLARGLWMTGRTVASLVLDTGAGPDEVTARDLEDAFTVWWLR